MNLKGIAKAQESYTIMQEWLSNRTINVYTTKLEKPDWKNDKSDKDVACIIQPMLEALFKV
eukprot:15011137-Ditylum_brightwellii.AAC.1